MQELIENSPAQLYEYQSDRIAVLVVSCDSYADLWQPFFTLFRRFWSDCPYQVYLLSNHRRCVEPNVTTILVGDDISWSDNVLKGLKQIQQECIFMFIEDLFLVDHVETPRIVELFRWFVKTEANYLRLNPQPKPDRDYDSTVGVVSAGTVYRTATVLSVWRKDVLSDLLKAGETAWDFEIRGTVRSDRYDKFFSTWEKLLPVENGVIKGKWQRSAVRNMERLGTNIDLRQRKVMTLRETVVFAMVILRHKMFNLLPVFARRRIRDLAA